MIFLKRKNALIYRVLSVTKNLTIPWKSPWILLFFILVSSFQITAIPASDLKYNNARFKRITIDDGLSQNFVPAITQDKIGFIWMGTKDGLNMYDGYRFTVYRHDAFDPYSISDNFVKVIYCDSKGRIWAGTLNGGLNVFDPFDGKFYRFQHYPSDSNSISSNNVQAITEDKNGDIWVGTNTSGLNRLHIKDKETFPFPENVSVTRIMETLDGIYLGDASILSLTSDSNDRLWIGTDFCILMANISNEEPVFRHIQSRLLSHTTYESSYPAESEYAGRSIFEDQDGEIWMLNRHGLFNFISGQGLFQQFILADPGYDLFRCLAATSFYNKGEKEIWLCKEDRIVVVNTTTGKVSEITQDTNNNEGLQQGHLISLFVDRSGTMWIGSNGYGVSLFDPYSTKFGYPDDTFITSDNKPFSSKNLSIRSFYTSSEEDKYLWIGANSGFYRVNRKESKLTPIATERGWVNDEGLIVYSITGDKNGILWLGSSWGLISYNPKTGSSKVYGTMLRDLNTDTDPRVAKVCIMNDEIWILTANSIAQFDRQTGYFEHYRYNDQPVNRFKEMVYPVFLEDNSGNFWLGTPNGLQYFNVTTRRFKVYKNDPQNPESLNFNDVRAVISDPYNPGEYLWLATGGGGISRFDIKSGLFRSFTEKEGLANRMVYGMLADGEGSLWLSTNNGLSKFDIKKEEFINYSVSDGLQSNEFNSGAFFQCSDGEMFFGGIKGYNHFFPDRLEHKQFAAPVVFTAFNLLNDTKKDRETKILDEFLHSGSVHLPHNLNFFNIEFSALDYSASNKKRYSYSFTRKGEQWIDLEENRYISFTDVKPGNYTLRVRGTNSDGIWSSNEALMSIIITKPWWNRNLAYLGYLLILIWIIYRLRKYEMSRILLQNRIEIADFEANKQKEVNLMKSQFFANISHEFRTPLTLIKGPIEELISTNDDSQKQQILNLMQSNTDKLLNLVNQLLDLSKLESGQYTLEVARGNVNSFLHGCVMMFSSLAEQKNINLLFIEDASVNELQLQENFYFDRDAMQKIMNNLLSNAIKFTPEEGKITVTVSLYEWKFNEKAFEVTVADTGIGIHEDKLPFIYDRFYQVDSSPNRIYEGSGIGLAYVKELVDAHKGTISVESKPNEGTSFKLRFPMGIEYFKNNLVVISDHYEPAELNGYMPSAKNHVQNNPDIVTKISLKDKPIILIVEDHDEVRQYILDCMKDSFTMFEAANALRGIQIANDTIPDLIISDVMMPGMDGFEFCNKIKSSEKTSHIPIIMLTARAAQEDKISGLDAGADDYLAKPFNTKELLARAKNLIENRRLLREKFSDNTLIKPSEISVSSRDQVFMEKLLKVVEANMDNEKFGVEDLSGAVAMSQSQLHRKLKAIINQSANHFIRMVRMNRAKELLEKDAGNISEVAYKVGYEDPGYFSKTYKAFFGNLPSEVKKQTLAE
jgi:signal transduction histidine kinase/ligand-binding sensor domain-containing protein/DNA-binding response OmpR family regulator